MGTLTHYPVTTRYWRGVWGAPRQLDRRLRRACDWRWNEDWSNYANLSRQEEPTCDDCRAYRERLAQVLRIQRYR